MVGTAMENNNIIVRYDNLCASVNQNEVPLLTITAGETDQYPMRVMNLIKEIRATRIHASNIDLYLLQGAKCYIFIQSSASR